MSAVIEFPANRISKAAKDETGQSADVIIFPGVQIERPSSQGAQRQKSSKSRKTPTAAQ